jgi:Protein of unknown function (DUF3306)
MSKPTESPEPFSLSRWSRRKREAAREKAPPVPGSEVAPPPAPVAVAAPPAEVAPAVVQPLPPVESLTIDSDFRAFLAPKVDEDTKRAALKKLFSDPHFNVMDGLDIYIDDYSKPDPMPEGMLAKLRDVYNALTDEVAKEAPTNEAAAEVEASPEPSPADAVIAKDGDAALPPEDDKPA